MTETLYRKYRPQRFADVVGQEHICTTLQHQLESGKLAHAYLFCGMRGIGKTTVARLLAKALNCEHRKAGESEPCNECPSCQAITVGRSLDVVEIDAASNRRIDDIRELREHIPTGSSGRYKVIIIDEVHMLTTEAFNALLKTLEEPPAHVVFVLATTEVHKIPDTILSRCQRFDFHRLSLTHLVQRLTTLAKAEGVKVEDEVLRDVAYLAGGSTRDAESYLGKLLSLGESTIDRKLAGLVLPHSDLGTAVTMVSNLIEHDASKAIVQLNDFLEEGGDIGWLHKQVLELLRHLLLLKLGGHTNDYSQLEVDESTLKKLKDLAPEITQSGLQTILELWLKAENSWRVSEVYQLPLELAIVLAGDTKQSSAAAGMKNFSSKKESAIPQVTNTPLSQSVGPELTLEQVNQQWAEIVTKLRAINHSLSFILSIARPTKLDGNILTITFQYKLHHERVSDPKIKKAIEQAVMDVLSTKLIIKSEVGEAVTVGNDLFSNVLSAFSGQVVDT